MAELWRYQDRLAAGQLSLKRGRNELDDILLHGSAGYGRADIRSDERDARAFDFGFDYSKLRVDNGNAGMQAAFGPEDSRISGMDPGLLEGASASLNRARSDIACGQDFPEAISRMGSISHFPSVPWV